MGREVATVIAEVLQADADVHFFVVCRSGAWIYAPIPVAEPVDIDADTVIERMRSGLGTHDASSSTAATGSGGGVGPDDPLAPAWMFVGVVAEGSFAVGAPDGAAVLLDEIDVRLLDRVETTDTARSLASTDAFGDLAEVTRRVYRLVAAGCLRHLARAADATTEVEPPRAPAVDVEPSAPTAAGPAHPALAVARSRWQRLAARASDAYRLSSKIRPLREAIDRARRRQSGEDHPDH